MPRRPKEPRYFPTKRGYYVQIAGVRHCLAKGEEDDAKVKEKAWEEFHKLMLSSRDDAGADLPLAVVLNRHLEWLLAQRSRGTYRQRRHYLDDFCRFHRGLTVAGLTKEKVDAWVASHRRAAGAERRRIKGIWGRASEWSAITCVTAALAWAVDNKHITNNPIQGISRPTMPSRGRECLISDAQYQLLLAYARRRRRPGFAQLLIALKKTGARPGELIGATAADYRPTEKAIVIKADENAEGRNKRARHGKDRTIYLDDELVAMVEGLARQHPEGPLFRTERGTSWAGDKLDGHFSHARKVLAREAAASARTLQNRGSASKESFQEARPAVQRRDLWRLGASPDP